MTTWMEEMKDNLENEENGTSQGLEECLDPVRNGTMRQDLAEVFDRKEGY